jgi:glycosyltransferase involved in cell wall biosynthesis
VEASSGWRSTAAGVVERRSVRVLVVSYAFPPTGGAGVQRVLKLVKYLPEHGAEPTVLTVANPSAPVSDDSLLRDVPPGVVVERTRSLEPGYALKRAAWSASTGHNDGAVRALTRRAAGVARNLLVPDPQILWQPSAQLAVARRLWRRLDDVVFVSGPPFSQFLLAPLTRLGRGTALVLDYRDEWSTYRESYEMTSALAARAGAALEPRLLAHAQAVTTATEAFRAELRARFPFLDPERVVAIPNGYDPEDFADTYAAPPRHRFVATYAGTAFRLTSPRALLDAVRLLHARSPELGRQLELRFVGRVVDTEQAAFAGTERLGVKCLGYLPHERVLGELAASHLTLCLLDEVPGAERIYPAKIFELMRLGRPCLVLAPPGALADLVQRHQAGELVGPRDVPAIAAALARRLRAFADGSYCLATGTHGVERYDRCRIAGEFAAVMRDAVRRAGDTRYQVTFWVPRAKRQKPTSTAAFSTTKLRESLAARPARDPSAAST